MGRLLCGHSWLQLWVLCILYGAALCQVSCMSHKVSCGGACCLLLLCLERVNRADALVLLPAGGNQGLKVHTHCAAAVCCTVSTQFHSVGALCRCCCAKHGASPPTAGAVLVPVWEYLNATWPSPTQWILRACLKAPVYDVL